MWSSGSVTLPQVEILSMSICTVVGTVVEFVMGLPLRVMNSDCAYSYKIPLESQRVGDRNYSSRKFVAVKLALVLIVLRCWKVTTITHQRI